MVDDAQSQIFSDYAKIRKRYYVAEDILGNGFTGESWGPRECMVGMVVASAGYADGKHSLPVLLCKIVKMTNARMTLMPPPIRLKGATVLEVQRHCRGTGISISESAIFNWTKETEQL